MGLEPTTFGITIRRSNQLSYIYRVGFGGAKIGKEVANGKKSSALVCHPELAKDLITVELTEKSPQKY